MCRQLALHLPPFGIMHAPVIVDNMVPTWHHVPPADMCRDMQVGFPVMIKATAGGGGRGMRLAMVEGDFMKLLQQAQQEADAAFGNPDMYLERYVQNPRHIEFQVNHSCVYCATA